MCKEYARQPLDSRGQTWPREEAVRFYAPCPVASSSTSVGMFLQQIVLPQHTKPGVRPAGYEASVTQQQVLVVSSIQPSSQHPAVWRLAQMQQALPSNMQHGSLPPGELHPTPQQ